MEEDGALDDGKLVLEAGDEALRPQERGRLQAEELEHDSVEYFRLEFRLKYILSSGSSLPKMLEDSSE